MKLKERIQSDIKECMKSKDKEKISVLRMLLSEIQYAQTAKDSDGGELQDAAVLKIVLTYQKRLTKSLAEYPDGEKKDQIISEIEIVSNYLPKKASPEDVGDIVDKLLSDSSERNFGVLMKSVLAKLGASADGKMVSSILKSKLAD